MTEHSSTGSVVHKFYLIAPTPNRGSNSLRTRNTTYQFSKNNGSLTNISSVHKIFFQLIHSSRLNIMSSYMTFILAKFAVPHVHMPSHKTTSRRLGRDKNVCLSRHMNISTRHTRLVAAECFYIVLFSTLTLACDSQSSTRLSQVF